METELLERLVRRMADEIDDLAGQLTVLDHALARSLAGADPLPPDLLQGMDLARQRAEGMAIFLGNLMRMLAAGEPPDPARAAAALPLEAQKRRLAGHACPAPDGPTIELWDEASAGMA